MKNQYFGDINDYRKYGLLRELCRETSIPCLVAWMLTPDDGRSDGGFTDYLMNPHVYRRYDPALFDALRDAVLVRSNRNVSVVESSNLVAGAAFYSEIVPDRLPEREAWFQGLLTACPGNGMVFLDPDNGIEVKSTPLGRKGSSKYIYWRELAALHERGSSLLVYQHFPRRQRDEFIADMSEALALGVGADRVMTFRTSNVLFLLAPQSMHEVEFWRAARSIARRWKGQINVGDGATDRAAIEGDETAPGASFRLF